VVSALCAHIIPGPTLWSRVAVVAGLMLVIRAPSSTPAALGRFLVSFHHLTGHLLS
jgi:hypothetical protein